MEAQDPNQPQRPDEEPTREEEAAPGGPAPPGGGGVPAGEGGPAPPGGGAADAPPGGGGVPPAGAGADPSAGGPVPPAGAGADPSAGGAGPPGGGGAQPPGPERPTAGGAAPGSRRLYRSRDDRVLGGVCGGLGRYFGIDPIMLRIAAVVLLFFGGASALAYVVALVLVPNEPLGGAPAAPPGGEPSGSRNRNLAIVAVVALLVLGWPLLLAGGVGLAAVAAPLAAIALVGLLVWWLVSGEGPGSGAGAVARRAALGVGVLLLCGLIFTGGAWAAGVGGGTVAAIVVIAAGVALLVGAFVGGLRLLILPALALALGVGFVAAAGIDLRGGVGQREYRPASAAQLHNRYRLGIGQLVVDLRRADLRRGDTPLKLKVGVGDALVLVPRDVCVASRADVGMGAVNVFDRRNGGLDVQWDDRPRPPRAGRRVVVDADVGVGALEVQHRRSDRFDDHRGGSRSSGDRNEGCARA